MYDFNDCTFLKQKYLFESIKKRKALQKKKREKEIQS